MKTKLFFAVGLLTATIAFGSNEVTSKSDETIKNEKVKVTLPVFTPDKLSNGEIESDTPILIYPYLRENVEYPEMALKYNIQGTEVVQFTVTACGEITDIKVVNSLCPEIDEEIVSVLKTTGNRWQPGLKNGKPVEMVQEIAMAFQISGYNNNLFNKRATILFKKGSKAMISQNNPAKALKYFDMALKYLPNESTILYSRGMAKVLLNDLAGARQDWNRVNVLAARSKSGNSSPLMTENIGRNQPVLVNQDNR